MSDPQLPDTPTSANLKKLNPSATAFVPRTSVPPTVQPPPVPQMQPPAQQQMAPPVLPRNHPQSSPVQPGPPFRGNFPPQQNQPPQHYPPNDRMPPPNGGYPPHNKYPPREQYPHPAQQQPHLQPRPAPLNLPMNQGGPGGYHNNHAMPPPQHMHMPPHGGHPHGGAPMGGMPPPHAGHQPPHGYMPPPPQQMHPAHHMNPNAMGPGGYAPPHSIPPPNLPMGGPRTAAQPAQPIQHNSRPAVFLFLGQRGSGKTTQAKKLANAWKFEYLSSGDFTREGKKPFVELRKRLQAMFENPMTPKPRGIVLDRWIATGTHEAYYLDYLLREVELELSTVFLLEIDERIAEKRAEQRDVETNDIKKKGQFRRIVENTVSYDVCASVYEQAKLLLRVPCTSENGSAIVERGVENIFQEIEGEVRAKMRSREHHPPLQPPPLCSGVGMVVNPIEFEGIKSAIQRALGTEDRFADVFPGSLMSGVLDYNAFSRHFKQFKGYFVTVKADGDRMITTKVNNKVYLLPAKYDCAYLVESRMIPNCMNTSSTPQPDDDSEPVAQFVFDSEFVKLKLKGHSHLVLVFDYLYFNGQKAKELLFENRNRDIVEFFQHTKVGVDLFCAKPFYPIHRVDQALDTPVYYERDGLVFQHNGPYRVPKDPRVYKWKPAEKSTIDVRVMNGKQLNDDFWVFDMYILADHDEKKLEGCELLVPADKNEVIDGVVVEALQEKPKLPAPKDTTAQWKFVRIRPDKLYPNREEVCTYIRNMEHFPEETLRKACLQLAPPNA